MNTFKPKALNQFNADAKLLVEFEHSKDPGNSFHYTKSVKSSPESVPEEQIRFYLSKIQRGGFIQPFGCLLAIEESTFKILAYSENTIDLFGLNKDDPLLGFDARTLFTTSSVTSLVKVVSSQDFSLINPVLVVSKINQESFIAVLHRIDVGILLDLEPSKLGGRASCIYQAVVSQQMALQAISRLQSVTRGDIHALCMTLIEDLNKLVGYDRIMIYKFHEDEHGEIISEIKRSDLEAYLGLHYPATDIPQAVRFMFKKHRLRMIHDNNATPVRIIQSEELKQPLILVNSALRASHDCHQVYLANMGTTASLVMAIIVNENESTKLWGLVSCHHSNPRYLPFSVRHACQFIMQAFNSQLSMEFQLQSHISETKILKTHALLCDVLFKNVPFETLTKFPNIMDLVSCNGAAFYYNGVCRILGVAPSEFHIKDITQWLLDRDKDLSVWSTNSLVDVGYPNAYDLGGVCGMVAARLTQKDFLFWFRSEIEKEVRLGEGKQILTGKEDGIAMHPKSSFHAFFEVVKNKSLPWEERDITAIQSIQHTMLGPFQDIENDSAKLAVHTRQSDAELDKSILIGNEMDKLLETALAPIVAVDSVGNINRWNSKIANLTGLPATEATGKSLVDELLHEECRVSFRHHLSRALQGEEDKKIELRLKTSVEIQQKGYVSIMANARSCKDPTGGITSVWFVGQEVSEPKVVMSNFSLFEEDYKSITRTVGPLIPPFFVSDESAQCSEWNASMETLTGWKKTEVIGKMIPGEIFGRLCRLKSQEDITKLIILFYQALCSKDEEKLPFAFFNKEGRHIEVILTTKKMIDINGHITGCFCYTQILVPDMQEVIHGMSYHSRLKYLEYNRQEIRYPLSGIEFIHQMIETIHVPDDLRRLLDTSYMCARQMMAIIETTNIESIENGSVKLNMNGFLLESVMDVIASQVKMLLLEKNLHLIHEIPQDIKGVSLYGDEIRFQQVLSNFLVNIVHHTPIQDTLVELKVDACSKLTSNGHELVQLHLKMIHQGEGLPSSLIHDMFYGETQCTSQGGFGLKLSRRLLTVMNGDVEYIREANRCYFLVCIAFETFEEQQGAESNANET